MKDLNLKNEAIALRKSGWSYPMITAKLGIQKGTLNYWLGKLELDKGVTEILLRRSQDNLVRLRAKALVVNKLARQEYLTEAKNECVADVAKMDFDNHQKTMLLVGLYMGEGFKMLDSVGFGNSNAKILRNYVDLLRSLYRLDESKLRCFLHLRADQIDEAEKKYWSEKLNIPLENFRKTQYDARTLGKQTRISYHGVCALYYYDARLAKKLYFTALAVTEKLLGGG